MRRIIVGCCLAAVGMMARAAQEPVVATDLVVGRCHDQYSEFGVDLVRSCISEDLAAVEALNAYPPKDRPRIDACVLREFHKGWSVVLACVVAGDKPVAQ